MGNLVTDSVEEFDRRHGRWAAISKPKQHGNLKLLREGELQCFWLHEYNRRTSDHLCERVLNDQMSLKNGVVDIGRPGKMDTCYIHKLR